MKLTRFVLTTLAATAIVLTMSASETKESGQVREIIIKVNNKWQAEHPAEHSPFWDNAAYHTGNMEAYSLIGNDDWRDYSERWAEHNQWKGAKSDDRTNWKYNYG